MEPWYKVSLPRAEVREGRSFNPDEFAIALQQVIAGTAPPDYRDPLQFFSRTVFTRALREHTGMVLRRLSGQTEGTPPVLTLVTQFGGGKTHTLTALYHLVRHREAALRDDGVRGVLRDHGLTEIPEARVAVFVGNAWDPAPGRETPWLDLARQLAGDAGAEALGETARTVPPGTEALERVFRAAGGPVLVLMDEVLNFIGRYRQFAEPFYAFLQNLSVAMTGTTHSAAVISLPRSQVEMTDWDRDWHERVTKVVRRVARDLLVNDEREISEVLRRRLFEDLGPERARRSVARAFAEWCFERRAQLPPEWTAVDTAQTEARAREHLLSRFETCYPFHPATLSVFQRKWQTLPQYQQTRGTLAMLAQWISWAYRDGFQRARREPVITLGSAPLEVPEFRTTVLGQLGEMRLIHAIEADIAGEHSHARALDADSKGPLRDIHRRVGTAILFESSGGMVDKVARLPELRFSLGEPDIDTTSIDSAAIALENKGYYLRRVGTDGFRFGFQPTLKKVVADRRASLDEDEEIRPTVRSIVKREFERNATLPVVFFPDDTAAVPDQPRLTLVVLDPESVWQPDGVFRGQLAQWTRERVGSGRKFPAALVWCARKPGRDLRDEVENLLAWRRVAGEIAEGTLGGEFEPGERRQVDAKVREAEEGVRDEVWGSYRYVIVADAAEPDGLRVVDLGAGHASAGKTLTDRIVAALKAEGVLSDSIGAGYLDRSWPEALRESGAWPLSGLRKAFLDGSLIRLLDPERVLREKIPELIGRGDFGLATDPRSDGTFGRIWFKEAISPDEVSFDDKTFLVKRARAEALLAPAVQVPQTAGGQASMPGEGVSPVGTPPVPPALSPVAAGVVELRVHGPIPPEIWNKLGTRLVPKLRQGKALTLLVDAAVEVEASHVQHLEREIRMALVELGVGERVQVTIRGIAS